MGTILESSLSFDSTHVQYAQFGRCQNIKTGKTRCAISLEDCIPPNNPHGEKWYNVIRLKEKDIDAVPCVCDNTLIGACKYNGEIKYECAPRSFGKEDDYCREMNNIQPTYEFLPANPSGTNCFCDSQKSVEDDTIHTRTKYGACYIPGNNNAFFCAYSSDYCTSNHIWIHPNNVPDILGDGKYCHCENTHIGGCVGGFQDFHCGVSSLDCRTNQFVLPLKLKEEHNHACFLCKQTASIDDAKVDELGRIRDNNTSHNANKTVTISVIGTMLVLGLVTICFVFLKRKKRRQKPIDSHSNHIDEVLDDDEVLDEKDVEDLNETKLV